MIPGFHLLFVAVHNDNHVVGGTEMGAKFLREIGTHVPHSFLGYLSTPSLSMYVCMYVCMYVHTCVRMYVCRAVRRT